MNLRIKPRQRLAREKPLTLAVPTAMNQGWSMDFMHDQLADGRSIRLFNVIGDYNREGDRGRFLAAIRSLDRIIEYRGKPSAIRYDNGPEYISAATSAWAAERATNEMLYAKQLVQAIPDESLTLVLRDGYPRAS